MIRSSVNNKYTYEINVSYFFSMKTFFVPNYDSVIYLCILWQYGLWSFQAGGTKLERFLHKNQHTQRKFEFWINGELSKIGHHFSNKKI